MASLSLFRLPSRSPSHLKTPVVLDWSLITLVAALLTIGLVMMSSASIEYAARNYETPFYFMARQILFTGFALIAGYIAFQVPMAFWQKHDWKLLLIGFGFLLAVITPGIGREVNGSSRWISLGVFNLQSSEIAKFCVLVYLAGYLVRREKEVRKSWTGFAKPLAVLFLMIILLLAEPDFGAVVVMVAACMGMIFLGGVKLLQFLGLIGASIAAVTIMAVSSPYRMKRLSCFVNPWEQPFDCGYQLIQSLIAFGRGEFFGLGLGNSVQKLYYLPEAHTDFVFAILAEELGFVGGVLVIALFAALIMRFMNIARRAEQAGALFSAYLAYGIGLVFSAQIFINIGVNTGLLPTKGLTLPFLSYGGSSLIVSVACCAVLLRIHHEIESRNAPLSQPRRVVE